MRAASRWENVMKDFLAVLLCCSLSMVLVPLQAQQFSSQPSGSVVETGTLGNDLIDPIFIDRFEGFRECSDCPLMLMIRGGSFTQGAPASEPQSQDDERPTREVTVPPFAIGQTEVTFAQWDACVADAGCSHNPGDQAWGRGDRPVINVNWNDAQEFVAWLSKRTGEDYRLPSESEWEYATRAGNTSRFNTGDCITAAQANFDGRIPASACSETGYRVQTVPVKSFAPNALGLYDTHGNVWEWVQDCWNSSYAGSPTDGSAWMKGDCSSAVLRGGSWNDFGQYLRSANRLDNTRGNRSIYSGFRVARSVQIPTFVLEVSSSGSDLVSISADPEVYSGETDYSIEGISVGTMIELTAPPSRGEAQFDNWAGCGDVLGPESRTCRVSMTEDQSVTVSYTSDVPTQCDLVPSLEQASSGQITQAADCLDDNNGEDCTDYTSVFGGTPFPGTQIQQRFRLFTNTYAAFEFTTPLDLNGTHTGAFTAEVYALVAAGTRLMSISDCPGDFDAGRLDSRCILSRSGPETLRWQGADDSFRCPLEPDTTYYLNILYSNDQPGTPMNQIGWDCSDPIACGNLITPVHSYP